jgi:hypothetical protein
VAIIVIGSDMEVLGIGDRVAVFGAASPVFSNEDCAEEAWCNWRSGSDADIHSGFSQINFHSANRWVELPDTS